LDVGRSSDRFEEHAVGRPRISPPRQKASSLRPALASSGAAYLLLRIALFGKLAPVLRIQRSAGTVDVFRIALLADTVGF